MGAVGNQKCAKTEMHRTAIADIRSLRPYHGLKSKDCLLLTTCNPYVALALQSCLTPQTLKVNQVRCASTRLTGRINKASSSQQKLQWVSDAPEGSSAFQTRLLSHRVGHPPNHHITSAQRTILADFAAHGRTRLNCRELHWTAPIKLTAVQPSLWL